MDNDGEEVETRNEAMAMGFEIGGGLSTVAPLKRAGTIQCWLRAATPPDELKFKTTDNGPEATSLGELNPGGPFLTLSVGTRF